MNLQERICVVTGASSGIGAACAVALADAGAAVVALARRFAPADVGAAPAPGRILEVGLDVADEGAVRGAFARLETVDVLVNAAGVARFARFADADVADLRAMLEVHVVGSFLCGQEAIRHMARGGHIVDIDSIAADAAFPECAGYTAAKAGQRGLARVMREELRASGIRHTSMIVGATDTPVWDRREGFEREHMLRPQQVAAVLIDVLSRPSMAIDEIKVLPPRGVL